MAHLGLVYYWILSVVTELGFYLKLRTSQCIDSLGTALTLFLMVTDHRYLQMHIEDADQSQTAFTSHHVSYRLSNTPFTLGTALETLQRTMDVIISPFKLQFALVYLDDVIIFTQRIKTQRAFYTILLLLLISGVMLNAQKSKIFTRKLDMWYTLVDWNSLLKPRTPYIT